MESSTDTESAIPAVIDALVGQLKPDHYGLMMDDEQIVHVNFNAKVRESLLMQALAKVPEGFNDAQKDAYLDGFMEGAKNDYLEHILGERQLDGVKVVVYLQPTNDHLANARMDWLLEQLPAQCEAYVIHIGDDGVRWIEGKNFTKAYPLELIPA